MRFENVTVSNMECAFRGMRNPLMSHSLSDTKSGHYWNMTDDVAAEGGHGSWVPDLGPNDYDLARRLVAGGCPHRKFMRQIFVSVELCKFSVAWMVELDTYKVGTVLDCSSTMHKITSRDLTIEDFAAPETVLEGLHLDATIDALNTTRSRYLKKKATGRTEEAEKLFRAMKRMLPCGYLYERATWTGNYEVLANIYKWRHNHRLPEWRQFCTEFVERLPYAEFITGHKEEDNGNGVQ